MVKKSAKRRAKKSTDSVRSSARKARDIFRKKSVSPSTKDTSGKLKAVHGRASKSSKKLSKKQSKSKWHKEFYKNAPKSRVKRFFWLLHPKRQANFWFSKHGLKTALKFSMIGFAGIFIVGLGVYGYYSRGLPEPEEISRRLVFQTTKFYDRTGKVLLYEVYGDENRTVVEFDKISDYAKQATIAIEDKNFYDHNGISISGIIRSAFNNARTETTAGGSTITQQFVKNSLLTNEKTIERKIKEAILALELERIYTKDEILGFYLNEVPYGGTSYGIESAANNYFAKSANQLTIDEAAVLAAMIQRPTFFSPYGENTDALIERRNFVIELMQEQGYITREEADEAIATDTLAKVGSRGRELTDIKAPHFVLEVQRQLEEKYGPDIVAKRGLKVITTIDMKLQRIAERAVKSGIPKIEAQGGNNAALSASDPKTGQVLAQVGSRDFTYKGFGAYNAALARRQPGSSFKPYTYAKLMEQNYGAGSIFYDVKTDFGGGYLPNNFDFGFKGNNTLRLHLAESRNIPAVKAAYIVGIDNLIEQVEKMGVSLEGEESDYGLSLTLGAGEVKVAEHVHGYTAFANEGISKPQTYVLKVENAEGEILEEWEDTEGTQVLDPEIAYIMSDILSDRSARLGTFGFSLQYFDVDGAKTAIKTGTTNDSRDGWLMGYSTNLVAGVWVGHSANKPMSGVSTHMSGPIWHDFMEAAHKVERYKNPADFKRPSGVKTLTIDTLTGRKPADNSKNTRSDIFPSWYKLAEASTGDPFEIDTVSGLLATECTPDLARETVQVGGVSAEIPPSDPAFSRWNPPVQALAAAKGVKSSGLSEKPTKEDNVHDCDDDMPTVNFNSSDWDENSATVSFTRGTHKLDRAEFKIDGQIVSGGKVSLSSCGSSCTKTVNLSLDEGEHTLEVTVYDKALYTASNSDTQSVDGSEGGSGGDESVSGLTPSGFTTQQRPTFNWNNVSGATYYRIYCGCFSGSKTKTANNSNYTPTSNPANGTWTWTVRAYNSSGSEIASGSTTYTQI